MHFLLSWVDSIQRYLYILQSCNCISVIVYCITTISPCQGNDLMAWKPWWLIKLQPISNQIIKSIFSHDKATLCNSTNNIYDYLWQIFLYKLLTIRAVADVRTHKHQAIYEMTWGQLLKTGKGDLCAFTQWVIASCASWHSLYKPLKITCSTSLSPLKALHIYCIFLPARYFACYQLFHKGEENLTVWTQDNQTVPSNFSSLVLFPCF